jgi:hypothetical protein
LVKLLVVRTSRKQVSASPIGKKAVYCCSEDEERDCHLDQDLDDSLAGPINGESPIIEN